MTASRQPPSPPQRPDRWSGRIRIVISLLLLGHLLAVILPPLAFQSRGPLGLSPSVEAVLLPVERYSQWMYMNRGYAFFAPEPGPSHLIQAGLTDNAGKLTEKMYPDRDDQWPRLMYHRHFMLSEFLNEIHQPPGPPPELVQDEPEIAESWHHSRDRYEQVRRSMVSHLEHVNPGSTAALRRIEHLIPGVIEFQQEPIRLTDRRLYQVLLDQPVALQIDGNLVAPDSSPEDVLAPGGEPSSRIQEQKDEPILEVEP